MTFATNIKAARLAAGLTQRQAAEIIGVSFSTYCNWETGRTEPPIDPVITQDEAIGLMCCPPLERLLSPQIPAHRKSAKGSSDDQYK